MIDKTLDNKIIINLGASGMTPGYVLTTFYHNSIDVFKGRTYLASSGDTLSFCLNDIVKQNRGPIDYLKLNNDEELTTIPLVDDIYGTTPYQYRFKLGQCNRYGVQIEQGNVYYNNYVNVLSAYHYPNKDLKCHCMNPFYDNSTSLDRIMQGTDWFYDHDTENGVFKTILLPHYPKILTKKFGIGLLLYVKTISPSVLFSLRRMLGNDLVIGSPIFNGSSMTFVRLYDFLYSTYYGNSEYLDGDDYVWLKLKGTSGDEFGDWDKGYTYYPGNVTISALKEKRYIEGSQSPQIRAITRSNANFETMLLDYIDNAKLYLDIPQEYNTLNSWNANTITKNPDTSVYYKRSFVSESDTQDDLDEFISYYEEVHIKDFFNYSYWYEPVFETSTSTVEVPDRYYGTCPVAILDTCYSRYYLAWYDRYGDIQSQAFDGKIEFNEDIDNEEIQDYLERRRISNVSLTPKWTLNTKWLSDAVYPIYESIYSSPYLLLYDTEQDRAWNVIVTDKKYKEKQYKNDKMFNLTLNVEANENQNMIY